MCLVLTVVVMEHVVEQRMRADLDALSAFAVADHLPNLMIGLGSVNHV
jgi:hypothetical protein